MEYQVGDWVKCPGTGKALWVYGVVVSICNTEMGQRLRIDRGYIGFAFYSPGEIKPAAEIQSPTEIAELRKALKMVVGLGQARKGERR